MRFMRIFLSVAVLLILQSCCRCCFRSDCDEDQPESSEAGGGRIGAVYREDPQVRAGPSGALVQVNDQRDLNNHDEVHVASGGKAHLEFFRGASGVIALDLYNNSKLERIRADAVDVGTSDPLWVRIRLAFGLAAINVKSGGSQQVSLPNGVDVRVLGTDAYVLYDPDTGYASIGNFEGSVTWSFAGGQEVRLSSGNLVDVEPGGGYIVQPLPFDREELDSVARNQTNQAQGLMGLRRELGGDVPPVYQESPPTEPPVSSSGQAVRVVVMMPLSGPVAEYGLGIQRAAEMAVQDRADLLNSMGYQVEVVYQDDQLSPEIALRMVQAVADETDILCSVGPLASRVIQATADTYHNAGLAFISPSATSRTVTEKGYLEVNRLVGWDEIQGTAAAIFAAEQGYSFIVLSAEDDDYSQSIANRLKQEASSRGMKVMDVSDSAYIYSPSGTAVDLVYYAGSASGAAEFFRYNRDMGYYGPLMGSDSANTPELLEIGSTLLLEGGGLYYTSPTGPASYYPGAAEFQERYQAGYGSPPPLFAAQGYDAMSVCLDAIQVAARSGPPNRLAVARAIRENPFYGITGYLRFNQNGDLLDAPYFIIRAYASYPNSWHQDQQVIRTFNISP